LHQPLPHFKYHPKPLETGSIVNRKTHCPVCDQEQDSVYVGPFYSTAEVEEEICPWCIKNGDAANKFDGIFQDPESCESVEKEEYIDELIHRTPGYIGRQQEVW
jgi:uncharacterized protein CbrC (UPF0167 family)